MSRVILGVLAAPVLWGLLSVPVNLLLGHLYGEAIAAPPYPTTYLLASLVLSFGYSLFAGWGAARIAGGAAAGTMPLGLGAGVALLAVGIAVQISVWDTIPIWWHLIFLAMLIPMCLAGARLAGVSRAADG